MSTVLPVWDELGLESLLLLDQVKLGQRIGVRQGCVDGRKALPDRIRCPLPPTPRLRRLECLEVLADDPPLLTTLGQRRLVTAGHRGLLPGFRGCGWCHADSISKAPIWVKSAGPTCCESGDRQWISARCLEDAERGSGSRGDSILQKEGFRFAHRGVPDRLRDSDASDGHTAAKAVQAHLGPRAQTRALAVQEAAISEERKGCVEAAQIRLPRRR